jgi:spermidine/putrescine transport system permease protein
MKIFAKIILIFVLVLVIIPVFSIFYYSFLNTGTNNVLHWYSEVLKNGDFLNALWLSVKISFVVSLLTTIVGFVISLSWFNTKQRYLVILLIVVLGLIPPDIIALGLSKLSQLLQLQNVNLFFTIIGLTLYTLPFIILLLWSRYYFIDDEIIKSARDIGMKNRYINVKIILPMSISALISSFIFSFILSLNEYPRTYYLSGYHSFLSEYLYGKLRSGTDESIYAGSGVTILITCLFLLFTFFMMRLNTKRLNH